MAKSASSLQKLLVAIAAGWLSISTGAAQFAIGNTTVSYTDPARSRTIEAIIQYPANTAGTAVPCAAGSFPVLVFGHGFLMGADVYDVIWQQLVPEGFIMVLPTTEGSVFPSHQDFAKDIAFLADQMQLEGADAGSLFHSHVAPATAAMGHSMGGGAAILSAQYSSQISAVATLAAAETNPSAIAAATGILLPTLTIAGANDCVTPPADHQLLMYNSLSSSCKTYAAITGASHCQFASFSLPCTTGELTCSPGATISAAQQQSTTANLLLPWLEFYLKNDCAGGDSFQQLLLSGALLTSQQNCALSCLSTHETANPGLKFYPNPANDLVHVEGISSEISGRIFSADGREVLRFNAPSVRVEHLPQGLYFLCVEQHGVEGSSAPLVIAR
jgi:predicted dienelactone hydrolase